MSEPRAPNGRGSSLELPCGERIDVHTVDMGRRELECACGAAHAVVTDVHPPTRFLPGFLVETLQGTVETADDFEEFGTPHLMGTVLEEFPEAVASADVSEDGQLGYAMLWITEFDARRLHEVIVELVIELMEHALSHADDEAAMTEFEAAMLEFDVSEFVDQYREERETTADDVPGYTRG